MSEENEAWIEKRAEAIMGIAESRAGELADAMKQYMLVVRTSETGEKREKARTKPALFAHDTLRSLAIVIAYGECEAGRDPYDDDGLIRRINQDLLEASQHIVMGERPPGGRTH